ncbi:hypothetical protein BSKO_12280 [Bryopsis sp. KO-2023]|nr:hypothetical protein BSKO_12280 [Bryopsis sp. KO-2023]
MMQAGRAASVVACVIAFAVNLSIVGAVTLERDVVALKLFREEVQDRGMYWSGIVSNWQGGGADGADDPCGYEWKGKWEGVECRDQEHLPKDVPRVVTNIHMTDSRLTGPVPLALTLLSNLTEIDMDGNQIEGPLNPYMGCLENLKELDLANNSLSGTVPTEWRFLTQLVENEIENNPNLSGCLPKGLPPTKTVCRTVDGKPFCELIGSIYFDTSIVAFCQDFPEITKKCATPELVREFINRGKPYQEYFQSGSEKDLLQSGEQAND